MSVRERVEERLALAYDVEPRLRSLVLLDADGARRQADALDRGGASGPLAGVVVVVKDNIDVAGQVTGCCSGAAPDLAATADAPVVARLRDAGAVVLGRANMDELAMGASTATSVHGPSRNPHDPARSPGGSSGGCAVAVAAGLADLAIGTDTGGSVREPAAQCGVLGLAPTPGLVSTTGVVPFDTSCDRVGPLAADPVLLRRALEVMAGGLPTAPRPEPLRVGLVHELCGPVNQPAVLAATHRVADDLRSAGAIVDEVSVPDAPHALAAYLDVTSVAAADALADWAERPGLGREVARRLALGRALADDRPAWAPARRVHRRLREQVARALASYDVLLSPTMPTTAPLLAPAGPPTAEVADPLAAPYTDCWTVVANLCGLPAISVPAGRSAADGLPVGVMLTGRAGSDALLLDLAGGLLRGS